MTKGEKFALWGTAALFAFLIVASLGVNRWRHHLDSVARVTSQTFVKNSIASAVEMISQQNYAGAKTMLDDAEKEANKIAKAQSISMESFLTEIDNLRQSPEIQYGAAGRVKIEGTWVSEEDAQQYREEQKRLAIEIPPLQRAAAEAEGLKQYDRALAALRQVEQKMEAMTIKPPELPAIKKRIDNLQVLSMHAQMAARGMVQYKGQWVTIAQKAALEAKEKGWVESFGEFVPPEVAATRPADYKVRRADGRWVTQEEKMREDGYVKYDGVWMRIEDRDAKLKATADADKKRQEEAIAATQKAERDREAAKLKPMAYAQSLTMVKAKPEYKNAKFAAFESPDVYVSVDEEGWFVVKGSLEVPGTAGKRTFYVRLRQKGADWASDNILVAD